MLSLQEWLDLLKSVQDLGGGSLGPGGGAASDEELSSMIKHCLVPDKINPMRISCNLIFLSHLGMPSFSVVNIIRLVSRFLPDEYDEEFDPTPSARGFADVKSRPIVFPIWFFSAYPDVARWIKEKALQDKNSVEGIFDRYLSHGLIIKTHHLRVLIDTYRSETGQTLECR